MSRALENKKRSAAYLEHQILSAALKWWKYTYYEHAESEISDATYDVRERRLAELESQYPELIDPNSPTQFAGLPKICTKEKP